MKGEVNGRVAIEKKLEGKGYSIEEFKKRSEKKTIIFWQEAGRGLK